MYIENDKLIYTVDDFEDTVEFFGQYEAFYPKIILFSIYQGSLTLGHRLSKQYNLPHSILKFQRMDGNDTTPTIIFDALDDYTGYDIFIIDDIYDTGTTMAKCEEFIKSRYNFETLNKFTIFSNTEERMVEYQHFNTSGLWVQFLPWEGHE